jgi:peptide/nickel transport system permease protein
MIVWFLRRLGYLLPILLGVNVLTFALFFVVNSPDDMARRHLGERHVTVAAITDWKRTHGYDRPAFINADRNGTAVITDTLFFTGSLRLFSFDFGRSDGGRHIAWDIRQRMWPSLAIALPVLMLELLIAVPLGLAVALLRGGTFDRGLTLLCVASMAISSLFFIIAGQFLFARLLRLMPISGFGEGWSALKFLLLPVIVQVMAGLGARVRWNRTVFLEEIAREHVRTARAKGLQETRVLFGHVLPNALLPLITTIVVTLPGLFLGSLITESFFAIPGLGSYTIDAIQNQDFAIVRTMVFIGSLLYILGLLLTDLAYAWADPRIRLDQG